MEQVFVDKMTEGTRKLGIVLSEKQMEQFYRYYELLVEWNKVMNLTGITELEEVVSKHFIDSLALVKAVPLQDGRRASAIDVGTGAGFPGLPLKIAFPNLKITLLGRDAKYREQYDYCVSRAVANAATLSEYCLPFVKVGGAFIPYKSGKIDEELEQGTKAIESLGGSVADVIRFELTGADADRSLVVIDKIAKTAKKYPRKAGMPSKEPIGK